MDHGTQFLLKQASARVRATHSFQCEVFHDPWDRFVETWASVVYDFVGEAFGGYHTHPLPRIGALTQGIHTSGANASFNIATGQVLLCPEYVHNDPGKTLEKLIHEFTHGALAGFPEGDPFYEEGFVDYSVWVMAHAPIWGEHRDAVIEAANYNIQCRRDKALKDTSDYDRKRWAGGFFAKTVHGPNLISRLRLRKLENNLAW